MRETDDRSHPANQERVALSLSCTISRPLSLQNPHIPLRIIKEWEKGERAWPWRMLVPLLPNCSCYDLYLSYQTERAREQDETGESDNRLQREINYLSISSVHHATNRLFKKGWNSKQPILNKERPTLPGSALSIIVTSKLPYIKHKASTLHTTVITAIDYRIPKLRYRQHIDYRYQLTITVSPLKLPYLLSLLGALVEHAHDGIGVQLRLREPPATIDLSELR